MIVAKKYTSINEWEKVYVFWPVPTYAIHHSVKADTKTKIKMEVKTWVMLAPMERRLTYISGNKQGIFYREAVSPLSNPLVPKRNKLGIIFKRLLSIFSNKGVLEHFVNSEAFKSKQENSEREENEAKKAESYGRESTETAIETYTFNNHNVTPIEIKKHRPLNLDEFNKYMENLKTD